MRKTLRFTLLLTVASPLLTTLCPNLTPQAQAGYQIDYTRHRITISPTGNYTADARKALTTLSNRADKNTRWYLRFQPGRYYLTLPLYSVGLQNVDVVSDPKNAARLIKGASFDNRHEYLFYTRMSKGIRLYGFEFYGKTSFKDNIKPVWSDQGVYFGSCRDIVIDRNRFFNFGNAAIRITTNEVDPVKGVHSFNTTVTNNYFNNLYQIATTSNDKTHGATQGYRLENNTFVNLRGSIKFASRTDGAQGLKLIGNTINGGDHFGFEIDNYDNVEIRNNRFLNIKSVAINIYTAGDTNNLLHGFAWGDNFTIAANSLRNVGIGIRYCHDKFFDGYQNVPRNLTIVNNTLVTVTEPLRHVPAIGITRGAVNGLNVSGNKLYTISNKNYIAIVRGCLGVVSDGNIAENNSIQPKIIPPPTTTN